MRRASKIVARVAKAGSVDGTHQTEDEGADLGCLLSLLGPLFLLLVYKLVENLLQAQRQQHLEYFLALLVLPPALVAGDELPQIRHPIIIIGYNRVDYIKQPLPFARPEIFFVATRFIFHCLLQFVLPGPALLSYGGFGFARGAGFAFLLRVLVLEALAEVGFGCRAAIGPTPVEFQMIIVSFGPQIKGVNLLRVVPLNRATVVARVGQVSAFLPVDLGV